MANKKLTKSNNKMIAGVCAGFGEYFGIDATVVRLIWAFMVLWLGFGILLYIVCCFIMPSAGKKSYQERMQERLDERRR